MFVQAVGHAAGHPLPHRRAVGPEYGQAPPGFVAFYLAQKKFAFAPYKFGRVGRRFLGYGDTDGQRHLFGIGPQTHRVGHSQTSRLQQSRRPAFAQGIAQPRARHPGFDPGRVQGRLHPRRRQKHIVF